MSGTYKLFQKIIVIITFASINATIVKAESNNSILNIPNAHAAGTNTKSSRLNVIRDNVNSNTVRIVLSSGSDTQVRIARDLIDILNEKEGSGKQSLRILPIMGDGGAQNALDVMFLRGADLAITQTDTLAHLRGENWFLYNDIFSRIHYITKLYNAEWHVIGRKKFTNIRQLTGKRVNISKPGSGTHITSRNIFDLLRIRVKYTTYSNAVALEKLRAGELDAIAWMGGAPIDSLQQIKKNEGLHFIPATFFYDDYFTTPLKNVLETFYLPSELKHKDYPNLIEEGQSSPTIANGVVLAVYNWSLSNNAVRKLKVDRFIQKLFNNFSQFTENGRHPKWKEVNLAAKITEWNRASLAKNILANAPRRKELKMTYKWFNTFLKNYSKLDITKMSEKEKLLLYANFQKFVQSQNQN